MPTQPQESSDENPSSDFLARDFEHWAESYWRNEELGETRIASFVGLVTAVLGALALLAKKNDSLDLTSVREVAIGALLGLIILGVFTFLRILRRNDVTVGHIHALSEIRRALVASDLVERYTAKLPKSGHRSLLNGGLAQTVSVIDAGLVSLLGWALFPAWALVAAPAGGVITLVVLDMYRRHREKKTSGARLDDTRFRAGVGIVVADGNGRVLALERRDAPGAWQLPQGGLERGEAPVDAAYRELREETGLERGDIRTQDEHPQWLAYELPLEYRSVKTGRGQVQKWFLFLARDPDVIKHRKRRSREAAQLEWKPLDEVIQQTAEFRKNTYEALREWMSKRPVISPP